MDLTSDVSELPKVGPIFATKFQKLGINTIENLLYHVPSRYMDYSNVTTISRLRAGEVATIHAKIVSLKNIYSKRGLKMQIGAVEDSTGKISVLWFNQPFLIKTLYPGRLVSISGKVGFFNRRLSITSPDYELMEEESDETMHTGRLVPVYPETSGFSSKWIRRKMKDAFSLITVEEYLPENILKKNKLIGFKKALEYVHFPKDLKEAEVGRERLAFNELLNLELRSLIRKNNWQKNKLAHKLHLDKKLFDTFSENLPFKLTESQNNVITEIFTDMKGGIPMNRLLEGDVGSGKTVVAAAGMFAAFASGYQSIIMAPTQILAQQHYQTLKNIFAKFNLRISLITGSTKEIAIGRSDIYVGTHSLIHSKVNFDGIALVVIDEQHRFGVEQRKHLIKKAGTPHVLTMTATPIPRTVALTSYGDMDLSILREMPAGRQKVTTWVVPEQKRLGAYEWIRREIAINKSQAFVVCPLIEDSETETLADVKSVISEFIKLKKIFSKLNLGLLHGRLKFTEKEQVLKDFKNGKIDILVTTPVVEVGIDIPNATIMVIESGERFGLAGLHQLRGRVGRGASKSYCLLFTNVHSGNAMRRLKAMEKTHSGFELSELDLKLRGPGEIFGTAQSGFPELKIASWNNYELIKASRKAAEEISTNLDKFPWVKNRIIDNIKQ
jgi:ATP-dependent DNA helicase RecG